MLSKIIRTSDDKVLTVLRLALAIVVFPHGAQKVLGWFGGFAHGSSISIKAQRPKAL